MHQCTTNSADEEYFKFSLDVRKPQQLEPTLEAQFVQYQILYAKVKHLETILDAFSLLFSLFC